MDDSAEPLWRRRLQDIKSMKNGSKKRQQQSTLQPELSDAKVLAQPSALATRIVRPNRIVHLPTILQKLPEKHEWKEETKEQANLLLSLTQKKQHMIQSTVQTISESENNSEDKRRSAFLVTHKHPRKSSTTAVEASVLIHKPSVPLYTIPKASAADIYKINPTESDYLPLELFDADADNEAYSPQQRVEIGRSSGGTHAKALFYSEGQWNWMACRVIAYDPNLAQYSIIFDKDIKRELGTVGAEMVKRVKRLSLLFDDDDQEKFLARLARCRALREQTLAERRYYNFIDSQTSSSFSSMQSSLLHRIMDRVMVSQGIAQQQNAIDQLIVDARNEYLFAMKRCFIDFMRAQPIENDRFDKLRLPPIPSKPPVPFLAVVESANNASIFSKRKKSIEISHYIRKQEAYLVVLELFKSWWSIHAFTFLDVDEHSMRLPLSFYEYHDHQESHFANMLDRVQNDWRALLINMLRDNLNDVFNFFVNDITEYQRSDLKRFVMLLTFIMRDQLVNFVTSSIDSFLHQFRRFAFTDYESTAIAKASNEEDLLGGFLADPSSSRPLTQSGSPLFVFRMSTAAQSVIFLPSLDTIEKTVLNLVDIPSKLQVFNINHDVVPLLGINESLLCTPESTPYLFEHVKTAQRELMDIIRVNLQHPLALARLYERYTFLLCIDAVEHAHTWFHQTIKEEDDNQGHLVVDDDDSEDEVEEHAVAHNDDENYLSDSNDEHIPDISVPNTNFISPDEAGVKSEELLRAELAENRRQERLKAVLKQRHSLEETTSEIAKYFDAISAIEVCSPSEVTFRMIKLECHLLKEQLISKAREIAHKLLEEFIREIQEQNVELNAVFQGALARLRKKSESVGELAELKAFTKQVETIMVPQLQSNISMMQSKMDALRRFQFVMPKDDFFACWSIVRFPQQLIDAVADAKHEMDVDHVAFQLQMQKEQTDFAVELENMQRDVDTFSELGIGTNSQMNSYSARAEQLHERLQKATQLVNSFISREQLFGDHPSDYSELDELNRRFLPYYDLWSTVSNFHQSVAHWLSVQWIELKPQLISKDINEWSKMLYRLEKQLTAEDALKPARVAAEVRQEIAKFKTNVPIITWLRDPGLRSRHWKALSHLLVPGKPDLSPDDGLNLGFILSLDLQSHRAAIEEICSSAGKEHHLEQQLEKMAKEWKSVKLIIEPYGKTGSYIMKGSDEVLQLLDDQIMKTQAMRGSPYIKVFEVKAKKWESRLQLIGQIMEEWLNCQKTWLYLYPIFSSEDIMRQLPAESRRFNLVDAYWRKTMETARKGGNLLDFVSETDNLLKTFQDSNKKLDIIMKHLNEYLETKRIAFPRFFFLSNDELLSILSQSKDATAVQPHLSKCFDAIHSLEFDTSDGQQLISGMRSAENELVPFIESINPNEGAKKGNVEIWLRDVERIMRETLKQSIAKELLVYNTMRRSEWVVRGPGQTTLAVTQIYWTKEVTEAIDTRNGLLACLAKLNDQIDVLVQIVRGKLDHLARLTLSALIVLEVHARDIVQDLQNDNINNSNDFEWLKQLRYYWEADTQTALTSMSSVSSKSSPSLRVKIINTVVDYAYEYLGNTARLVITPLTDRCYRTLMSAIHVHLGGAPEGPAGTGKTESTKDLAKAVAIQCVVFNCSEALNYRSMAKFFKGLASSGAWCCFDEFNRIDLEVLSVIAQQVSSIQRAIMEKKHVFFFDDVNISIIHTCSVFITMNPGYAGRTELPDNLKALFRTVAMMIPDYAMIAEIVLYSAGYSMARILARKIVACLRLSSEQLSSQDHYDFGMRNIKSVLTAAASLRAAFPDQSEDLLVLRALCDCNVPKFVNADISLFSNITKDLFPTVNITANENVELTQSIHNVLAKNNLQPVPAFVNKCIELYDTILVRHGVMLVGETMSGKSSSLRTLAASVSALKNHAEFADVDVHYINPKAVNLNQLYGADDPSTHEWTDGILSVVMRRCVADTSGRWKWIVFDGPVDAIWIENMNTVLDDNRKLCLASGEQIKLIPHMNMIFEVEDLEQASPATVSRCGMVFMESSQLGWRALVSSWIHVQPSVLSEFIPGIRDLFEWIFPSIFAFIYKHCKFIVPISQLTLTSSHLKLFSSLLVSLVETLELEQKRRDEEAAMAEDAPHMETKIEVQLDNASLIPQWIESIFIFSVVWSLGAMTDTDGRKKFSDFFKELLQGKTGFDFDQFHGRRAILGFELTSDIIGDIHDYFYDHERHTWATWLSIDSHFHIAADTKFQDIIVPTVDTVRSGWILNLLLNNNKHTMFTGVTGTAKTATILSKLLRGMDRSLYMPMMLTFSARTSANQTQDIIDGKLERRRAGVIGPPPSKRCIIFVDDLNMPAKDAYGAQPPIELLRQWMDYGGWYDRKTNSFKQVVDIQFVAAMGPPGGGRNPITNRYLRHFNNICLTPFNNESLKRIFSTILSWWLESFPNPVRQLSSCMVDATIKLYNSISSELLPTPAKSHYTFNLRDMSKVFQGIMSVENDYLQNSTQLIRLWAHECYRVFADRLIDDEDQQWFTNRLETLMIESFNVNLNDVVSGPGATRLLLFADFHNPRALKKTYIEIDGCQELSEVISSCLGDYNSIERNPLNLVLFDSAIGHICRISRILRQPFGNALLVGVGGSGRQSLTKLAAFIADYEVFQLEMTKLYGMNEWRDDLRDLLRNAGLHNKPIVFLFNDSQIKHEAFLEDINNILNNGEVPNLYAPEDYLAIIEHLLPDARKASKADSNAAVFSFFIERCKLNLHLVLCFSIVDAQFRSRLRQFPALVNCCTIDWFHAWSSDALRQVAVSFLYDVDLDQTMKAGIIDVCVDMQERVILRSAEYLSALQRHNYVTPTSYLELIKIFRNLFETSRGVILANQTRYSNGLQKLAETEVQVKTMQHQLEELQPDLLASQEETAALIVTIEQKSMQMITTRQTIAEEERECNSQTEIAAKIKDECELALAEAMPALNNAMKALKVLNKSSLDELKSMKSPTAGVILTIEALCIMMGVEPRKVGQVGSKTNDYWEPARKHLLSDMKLLDRLQNYDRDNIPKAIIDKIRPYCKNPDFAPNKIANASKAAESFCRWVLAMEAYDRIAKIILPKREALSAAQSTLAAAIEQLTAKKAMLHEVQQLLDDLNAQFDACNQKKLSLELQVKKCSERLLRAEKLLSGVKDEKDRWIERVAQLKSDYHNIVGNILLGSGVVSYLGVFTPSYRDRCITEWSRLLKEKQIPCDDAFQLSKTLCDPVVVRQWCIQHLPKDSFSIDNAIILTRSLRWGLLIDPQEQANKWIRRMEDDKHKLKVVKQTDDNFVRVIIMAVQLGLPVLLENIGESLDPVLEPLLLKQTHRSGSRLTIRIGSDNIVYHEDFRLYITTKLQNPHYSPEICTKLTLINFMTTPEGLQDQMLSTVVKEEEPELEQERGELIIKSAENQRQLQLIEDKILSKLSESEGNILDDEELIITLQQSKQASKTIEKRMRDAAVMEESINKTRAAYQPVAFSASNLFFCVADLAMIDPMYQFSLYWFISLFERSIHDSDKSLDVNVRTRNIDKHFLWSLYVKVCRSLFEKDKTIFSLLLTLRILQTRRQLDSAELRFLLAGQSFDVNVPTPMNNPTWYDPAESLEYEPEMEEDDDDDNETEDENLLSKQFVTRVSSEPMVGEAQPTFGGNDDTKQLWLPDANWIQIEHLDQLQAFKGIAAHIANNSKKWRSFYQSADPFTRSLPGVWKSLEKDVFRKLLVVRALLPDKLVQGIQKLITNVLGNDFVNPPPFDLRSAFQDSDAAKPIVFVLSPGVDPSKEIYKLATELGYTSDRVVSVSLGQGQGPIAEAAIREAVDKGSWVLLQNCHLALSWMPMLQKLVDDISIATTNNDFRLWLTSMPSPDFPVSILQNGIKITNEPPRGIKANLLQSYRAVDQQWFDNSKNPDELKRLFFSLCFFHAVVLNRRNFGPIGWNIRYEFTEGDLSISKTQLHMYINLYEQVPFNALRYLIGELNYGGRVTDDLDRRTLMSILDDFICEQALAEGYQFDSQGLYKCPVGADLQDYRNSISQLPNDDKIEVFGLHSNVNIITAIREGESIMETILHLQPRSSSVGGTSREKLIGHVAQSIEQQLPPIFDIETAQLAYPVSYSESMNTVLVQELVRFNRLLTVMKQTLSDLQKALKGEVVMSLDLELMADSIFDGQVPAIWSKVAYPSTKPLGSWVPDLLRRLQTFSLWILKGVPSMFWISGFFFTQSFLTGALQNHARKYAIPIDELTFDFEIMSELSIDETVPPPIDGVYIYGLHIESAHWNPVKHSLTEPNPRELFSPMPVIWLKPVLLKSVPPNRSVYQCPLYRTVVRRGILSTTGHSTNYVMNVSLPSLDSPSHWIKRGVALFCSLSE